MTEELVGGLVMLWVFASIVAVVFGRQKGYGTLALLLALAGAGPVALVAVLLSRSRYQTCPHCRSQAAREATVCPHCARELAAQPTA